MNTQGINVFNKAYGDHIVVRITNHFKLQLFPAKDRLFNQNLAYKTGLQTMPLSWMFDKVFDA